MFRLFYPPTELMRINKKSWPALCVSAWWARARSHASSRCTTLAPQRVLWPAVVDRNEQRAAALALVVGSVHCQAGVCGGGLCQPHGAASEARAPHTGTLAPIPTFASLVYAGTTPAAHTPQVCQVAQRQRRLQGSWVLAGRLCERRCWCAVLDCQGRPSKSGTSAFRDTSGTLMHYASSLHACTDSPGHPAITANLQVSSLFSFQTWGPFYIKRTRRGTKACRWKSRQASQDGLGAC